MIAGRVEFTPKLNAYTDGMSRATVIRRLIMCVIAGMLMSCSEYGRFQNDMPVTVTIDLEPGRKLESVEFRGKEDLWMMTRQMRSQETAEEHVFSEHPNARQSFVIKEHR